MTTTSRQPHAVRDLESRRLKAIKIQRILGLAESAERRSFLEIGTGSGGIANYFAVHGNLNLEVTAVDTVDSLEVAGNFHFVSVTGVELPFAEGMFDFVVSNHVIEHVGEADEQLGHLREIRRVLKPDGVAYLAVPNRWMLVEPHYRLAFLSWLPRKLRSTYLRVRRGIAVYDCEPLQMEELERMILCAGLDAQNVCIDAARIMAELEPSRGLAAFNALPGVIQRLILPLIPTLMYRLRARSGPPMPL